MEQCRKQHSGYFLGEVILNNPRLVCKQIPSQLLVVWVGVTRQKYKNVDQGICEYLIYLLILFLCKKNKTFMQMNYFFRLFSLTNYGLVYHEIIIQPKNIKNER